MWQLDAVARDAKTESFKWKSSISFRSNITYEKGRPSLVPGLRLSCTVSMHFRNIDRAGHLHTRGAIF